MSIFRKYKVDLKTFNGVPYKAPVPQDVMVPVPSKDLPQGKKAGQKKEPAQSAKKGFASELAPSPSGRDAYSERSAKLAEDRWVLVHELAVGPRTYDHLRAKNAKASGKNNLEELEGVLTKIATFNPAKGELTLKPKFFKEVDPWGYKYDTAEERELAIQNAIKALDRLRTAVSDPAWQKLLPFEERGKGKCLSTLQAAIANNSVRQREASASSPDATGTEPESLEARGTAMRRSESGGSAKSTKSGSGVLAPKAAATKKSAAPIPKKPQPAAKAPVKEGVKKTKPAKPDTSTPRKTAPKSSEFVTASDDEDEDDAPTRTNNTPPAPKPAAKPSQPAATTTKPVAKPITTNATATNGSSSSSKRKHDDYEESTQSSSSSSLPMSKRIRTAAATAASPAANRVKRAAPPTKRARPDQQQHQQQQPALRQTQSSTSSSSQRGSRAPTPPMDLVERAQEFKRLYATYSRLYTEVAGAVDPPRELTARVSRMHQRLRRMKQGIESDYQMQRA